MRSPLAALLLGTALLAGGAQPPELPPTSANPNVERAGVLREGVLTVALEAKQSLWRPDGSNRPGIAIEAFAEEGKSPLIPGPLVRVAQGTEIRVSVRNSLATPLTFFLPTALRGVGSGTAADSIVVAPGMVGTLTARATTPGNYVYRAMTPQTPAQFLLAGQLAGGLVIDSATTRKTPPDRVFVMTETFVATGKPITDTLGVVRSVPGHVVFMMNGLSWPHTERLAATTGDSLHWRIINASTEVHPMHLHGFYFRVNDFSPSSDDRSIRGSPNRLVVTERMPALSGMSISWSPDRAGNWIFHCHFARHIAPEVWPDTALDAHRDANARANADTNTDANADAHPDAHTDHAQTGMGGLVLGITVAERPGVHAITPAIPKQHLRLIAVQDKSFPDSEPSMRFVLEQRGRRLEAGTAFSPTIELTRGVPVSITVVNHLAEPTAVHWHGIELDSYNDGVAGVSGSGNRVAPLIAPRDSFEVRFTPPRAGTFMYHSHVNEMRQQPAGLAGALIVRNAGALPSANDHVFFLKAPRQPSAPGLEVNGQINPDTVVLHVGQAARFRFMSLAMNQANALVSLTARRDSSFANVTDTLVVHWRALAKDGADLPAAQQIFRPARQVVSMGETHDFEFTPSARGALRLEVRNGTGPNGVLLARVPLVVK
ncbi:MAG: multicopper oxidase domain-containing protein [Gemmatimonas sp.]